MEKPYFIIEVSDLLIKDIKYEFYSALKMGREIEFQYNGKNYFVSRSDDEDWYVYCEETNKSQRFRSSEQLLKDAMLCFFIIYDIWRKTKKNLEFR